MISAQSEYGIKFLIKLSLKENVGYVKVIDVAKEENISLKFLEGIVSVLKKNGFLEVKRGPNGGYRLGIKAEEICMFDVLNVLENNFCNVYNNSKNTILDNILYDYKINLKEKLIEIYKSKKLIDFVNEYNQCVININYQI